jgi:1-acyl-sn-glycerol-3-phosphate acyltransferase
MSSPLDRAGRRARAWLAGGLLSLLGWRFQTTFEHDLTRGGIDRFPKKFIVFGEPHTHLVDVVMMLLFFQVYQLPRVRFPVKDSYFKPVLGTLLRWLGAMPVDTRASTGMVGQLVEQLRASDAMILHIAPSGTRRRTERWRSGFYHVAQQAQVPVFMAYLDASTRTFGYAPPLHLSGDVKVDMDLIRAFYADKRGFVPANESRIWLKEEEDSGALDQPGQRGLDG